MNNLFFGKLKIDNRIYKNLKGLIFEFFSRTTVQIFFFPLMFYIWGTEYTGIWIFLTSISAFAAVTNMDPGEFTRQHMILNYNNKIENQKIYSNSFLAAALTNKLGVFVSTPKNVFPKAVERNKIKRRIKSIMFELGFSSNTFGLKLVIRKDFLALDYKEAYNEIKAVTEKAYL